MDKPLVTTEPPALIGYIATKGLLEEHVGEEPRVTRARDSQQRRDGRLIA